MSSSVGAQMPQLYLRGSLCNVTMRGLKHDEVSEVGDIVGELKDDPLLQPTRYEFRNILKYTIKGDYNDMEAADQEYQIALWRAVVAAKHGWGKHEPSQQTLEDPHQRKKFFQTWVFNYMRQILLENKRNFYEKTTYVVKSSLEAAVGEIMTELKKLGNITREKHNEEAEISANLFLCPSLTIDKLQNIKEKYFNRGIKIVFEDDKILLTNHSYHNEVVEVKTQELINMTSTSARNDDDKHHEIEDLDTSGFQDPDSMLTFYDNLSDDAQDVLKIMMDPPQDYIEKYGDKITKKYITEHLELSPKQTKEIWTELRLIYTAIIGVPE